MDVLASALSAIAAVYGFASLLFGGAFLRRPRDGEFGVFALLASALTVYAASSIVGPGGPPVAPPSVPARVAWGALLAAFALLAHFGVRYAQRPRPARVLVPLYALTAVLLALDARGLLHDPSRPMVPRAGPPALDAVLRDAAPSALGVACYALGCAAVASVLLALARAHLAGRREALSGVVGATVLLATSINDLGAAAGLFATTYLVNAGFVAFVLGVSLMVPARHAQTSEELDRGAQELKARSRELRRSYEELRAAQEQLVRKEQLAVVGELAAVIAHEVRNPLAIIGNAVAGLHKPTTSRGDQETLLRILEEETARLNRLVSDLLRFARPVSPQRQHIALLELLERGLAYLQARRPVRVSLVREVKNSSVWGDANLLRQVFDNLMENAVQAMGDDGTLTVRVRATSEDGIDGLAVDIIDTGEGMDTLVRSRARDPFFTTRPSGTGLGLAIVDRIVGAHGGRLLIQSRAGEGTTVTVHLPFGSSSEPPSPPRRRGAGDPTVEGETSEATRA